MWKFVMVGFSSDYFKYCFSDFQKKDTFLFLDNTMGNGYLSKVQKLCVSEVTNRVINIPAKQIWMNDLSKWLKYSEYNICFVFSKSQSWLLEYNRGEYIKLLRERYPECKIILYLGDLVSSYYKFDLDFFLDRCDYVISYDEEDANKYGLLFSPLPYGNADIADDDTIPQYDAFFCGRAKDRLQEIYEIYEYLVNSGLRTCFFVTDVSKKHQRQNGVIFNQKLDYERYLQYMKKSRAIVEVRQKRSSGDTLRVKEALTYGKQLITDNREISERPFYDSRQIFIYEKGTGIDLEEFKTDQNRPFKKIVFDDLFKTLNDVCYKGK